MVNRRARLRLLGSGTLAGFLALFLAAATVAAATQIGFKDQSISGASDAPSGSKPESKLWFNDGIWWGDMWVTGSGFHIFKLNAAGNAWSDTGTAIDSRSSSRGDALWDGSKLYIASHANASDSSHNTANRPAFLYRYSYNAGSKTYSLDANFPTTITTVATETLVIDKDSTGTVWATWTQAKSVKVAHTVGGNDLSWSAPITPAITGDTAMSSDDISSLIAFGGNKIGLMWSNQAASKMYFSTHADGDPDTTWSASEAATTGSGSADDHINLKTDSGGRVYAAVKTSFTSSSQTLTQLLVRSTGGSWTAARFGTVSDSHTRPIVVVDEANGVVHMFATGKYPGSSSGQSGGTIYEKTSPIGSISFPSGSGTPFIQDPNSNDLNNATSTKQNPTSASGIVVLATNDSTNFYWHNIESTGGPVAPVADFSANKTTGTAPLSVTFSDQSSGSPTQWSWDFGDGGTSSAQNPTHSFTADGRYTVSLTATNGVGSDTETKTNYITVGTAPTAAFHGSPTTGSSPLGVQFTDDSTGNPTSWTWDFGDSTTSTAQNPTHTYNADGTYTVKLTATNVLGSDTETKAGYVVVGTPPPPPTASFTEDKTTGTAPLAVQFTDTSTGNPTSWSWNFGDGTSSTLESPSHTYTNAGTYTVSLTATNASGSDTDTEPGLINVSSSGGSTLTFNPTADSYVSSSNLTGNYGTITTAIVREGDGSSTNPTKRTYLKFSLTGVGATVTAVKLRVFVTDASANTESVYLASDNSWGETTINYTNAPAIGSTAFGSAVKPAAGWVEITLDPSVIPPNPATLTLVLKSSATDSLTISTREDATNPPQLVVTSQ
jgi:PKD repeat protein